MTTESRLTERSTGHPTIAKVSFGSVRYNLERDPVRWGAHQFESSVLVVLITASDGATGLGVVWASGQDDFHHAAAAQSLLPAAVLGRDAQNPYTSSLSAQNVGHSSGFVKAACALELGLWDLAGNSLKQPTYQLLGCKRKILPAYVISAEEFSFTEISQYTEIVQRYKQDGFLACKLHLWGDISKDIKACIAIRDAVGSDFQLMLDPAGRYTRDDALRVGTVLQDLGFIRFEDPISPSDPEGYTWLKSRLNIPLVANEVLKWDVYQCESAAANGDVQGMRVDLGRAGITKALRMAAIAEVHGCELDVASMAPQGGLEACLHFGLSSANTRWFEHHEMLELNAVPGLIPGYTVKEGFALPNDATGLGFDIDWQKFEAAVTWA